MCWGKFKKAADYLKLKNKKLKRNYQILLAGLQQNGKLAITTNHFLRLSDTRYSAKGTKGKWRYASSKARLKCATYRR